MYEGMVYMYKLIICEVGGDEDDEDNETTVGQLEFLWQVILSYITFNIVLLMNNTN